MATNPLEALGVAGRLDPYAPIRTLPRNWFERASRNNTFTETDQVFENVERGWQPDAPVWGLSPDGFSNFDGIGGGAFQSKFGDVTDMGENRLAVKYQDPGKHKYDLLNAIYSRPDANSDWMLENDPTAARQASTGESFYRDPFEQFNKDFVLPAAAMYLGGSALTGTGVFAGAGTGGAAAGAGAAEAGIGTLGTIAPGSAALAPLATTGLASTAPAITATIPQLGGGLLAAGAASSAAGGASGGAAGAGGGSLVNAATSALGGGMDWSDWAKIGATLIGSGIQSNAASNAVDAQARSTDAAIAEQRRQFDLQRSDGAAYRDAGTNALSQFQTLANTPTTAADVMQDPGYQFGMDQGQQAIDRKVAAMGGRVSGAAIKAAGRFGTNYATTGFTAADQRRNDRLNRLAALAGIGQSATNASAAAGTSMANNISGLVTGQGNATGGGILAQGNIWGNTANQLAALYGRGSQQTGYRVPTSPFANYGGDYNSLDYQP